MVFSSIIGFFRDRPQSVMCHSSAVYARVVFLVLSCIVVSSCFVSSWSGVANGSIIRPVSYSIQGNELSMIEHDNKSTGTTINGQRKDILVSRNGARCRSFGVQEGLDS
jgi:hypothetical protein